MRAYLFALSLESVRLGKVYKSLPLHCTLMLWFYTAATPEELIEKTGMLFRSVGPLELVSHAPALFGKHHSVPVHTLQQNPTLEKLHLALLKILDEMGVEHIERAYVGDGFRPHVTDKKERNFPPTARATVEKAHLFEALDIERLYRKRAVAEFSLK